MKHTLFVLALALGCSKKSSSPPPAAPEPAPEPTASTEPPPAAPTPAPEPVKAEEPAPPPPPKTATATLAPTKKSKSKVTGTISFKEVADGVEVTANIENLKAGDHAWHVHEKGDCSAADAASAGEHFNPAGAAHGAPDAPAHHAGHYGNLTAGKDGKATKTFVMKGITLGDDANSIVGKGFIVHAKKDDLKSQPAGNAGDRVACGVIERAP